MKRRWLKERKGVHDMKLNWWRVAAFTAIFTVAGWYLIWGQERVESLYDNVGIRRINTLEVIGKTKKGWRGSVREGEPKVETQIGQSKFDMWPITWDDLATTEPTYTSFRNLTTQLDYLKIVPIPTPAPTPTPTPIIPPEPEPTPVWGDYWQAGTMRFNAIDIGGTTDVLQGFSPNWTYVLVPLKGVRLLDLSGNKLVKVTPEHERTVLLCLPVESVR